MLCIGFKVSIGGDTSLYYVYRLHCQAVIATTFIKKQQKTLQRACFLFFQG